MKPADKKRLSESDICDIFISPAIKGAGWDQMTQIRREVTLAPGPVTVRGNVASRNKKKRKFADYVLYREPNVPVAIVEAKDNNHTVSQGLQQALGYAEILNVPSAFSSNGDAFATHNKVPFAGEDIETQFPLDAFPAPALLWKRYKAHRGIKDDEEPLVLEPYYEDPSGKEPRYYQADAINHTIESVAAGDKRVLLVMATGTGKTYTTFQIIWRLWKAGAVKRALFLVDRNILVDQALINDFKPFGGAMTKVTGHKFDPAYEVHLALYQAITGTDEHDKSFKKLSREFFDLIVIDECHRGSADEDAQWREILEYFSDAIQIGMTATPRETKYVSNITYFGEPTYKYSLKQGIEDGFLAPYKVVRIDIDKDMLGWTPPSGMVDDLGREVPNREYNQSDRDRILVLNQRTRLVARRVMQYLNATDPYAKTIIFCEDIDHAERMRAAIVNEADARGCFASLLNPADALIGVQQAAVIADPPCVLEELALCIEQLERPTSLGIAQAAIKQICESSPLLMREANITASRISFPQTGAFFQALGADYASAAGAHPAWASADELWGFQTERSRRLFDELIPVPTQRISVRLTTTHAGYSGESQLLEEMYNKGKALPEIAPGLHAGNHFLFTWSHEPLAVWQTDSWLTEMRQITRPIQYLRQFENRFVSSENTFIDMPAWDRVVDPQLSALPADLFREIYVGCDASTKRDSSAIVAVSFDRDRQKVRLVNHRIFQPSQAEPMDFELSIEAYLLDLAKRFQIKKVLYDPYQMAASAQRLVKQGLPMEEYPQTLDRLTAMSQQLYDLITGQAFIAYPSEAIRLAISRTVALESSRGWRITKEKASHKIDVVVALAMACFAAVRAQGESSFDQSWGWVTGTPIGATPLDAEQRKHQAAREASDFYAAKLQSYLLSGGHGNGALPFTRDGRIDWGRLPRNGSGW